MRQGRVALVPHACGAEAVEKIMKEKKGVFANADFYSVSTYHFMDIPTPLSTQIFVLARVAGLLFSPEDQGG
jgi:2-methylcitrate synthase